MILPISELLNMKDVTITCLIETRDKNKEDFKEAIKSIVGEQNNLVIIYIFLPGIREQHNKILLTIATSNNISTKYNANKIVKQICSLCKGNGGGNHIYAQGSVDIKQIRSLYKEVFTYFKNESEEQNEQES